MDLQIDTAANEILDAIADEPVEGSESGVDVEQDISKLSEAQVAEQISDAIEEQPEQEAEPETPAIEPPVSWKADAKDKFQALPPDLQKYVAERESERERGYSKTQQELADKQKAFDAQAQSVEAERKAYAERLGAFVEVATKFNPKMAEWQQRDWAKYSAENPLEAPAEWFSYQQQIGAITAANAEVDRIKEQALTENRKKAHEVLSAKLDFWNDTEKRTTFQNDLREWAKTQDISPEEINSIENPKVLLTARKAMLYDRLMAEQARIAQAKKVPQPTRVLRAQATDTGTGNAHADRLAKIAAKSGRLDDQANAILAAL